jgi:tetratricopeptide (TPR) repeat protein
MLHLLSPVNRLVRSPKRLLAVLGLLALIGTGGVVAGRYLWAEYHFRAAKEALAGYRLRQARAHLVRCLEVWPDSGMTHLLLGRVDRLLGEFASAEEHLTAAQRHLNHTDELDREYIFLQAQTGQMDAWVPYLRRLVEEDHPAAPLALGALANGYMRAFRLNEAGFILNLWLKREPDNPQALSYQGWVLEVSDARGEAILCYRRALEADPDRDEVRIRLASLLVENQRHQQATPHLERLRASLPSEPAVVHLLAQCKMETGHAGEAQRLLDRLLARHPRYGPALTTRGELAWRAGQYDEAMRWLRPAIQHETSSYRARYLLYQCLQRTGKATEAEQQKKQLDQLRRDVRRLHEIIAGKMSGSPRDPSLHFDLAEIFFRSGEAQQGLRWLYSALKLDPYYQPARAALARYYRKRGDHKQAELHARFVRDPALVFSRPDQPGEQ